MSFDSQRDKALNTIKLHDRSDKGSVDERMKPLIDTINYTDDYYTTSSCSGRIIVISIPKNSAKKDAEFIYRTHDEARSNEVNSVINKLLNHDFNGSVWYRQEPAIIHVAARTLELASEFLRIARIIGFKRCGLFEIKKRFVMELVSTERIDTILMKDGKKLVSDEYLDVLVDESNKHLKKTWAKTSKLLEAVKQL